MLSPAGARLQREGLKARLTWIGRSAATGALAGALLLIALSGAPAQAAGVTVLSAGSSFQASWSADAGSSTSGDMNKTENSAVAHSAPFHITQVFAPNSAGASFASGGATASVSGNANLSGTVGPQGDLSLGGSVHTEAHGMTQWTGNPGDPGSLQAIAFNNGGGGVTFKLDAATPYSFTQTNTETGNGFVSGHAVQLTDTGTGKQVPLASHGTLQPGTYSMAMIANLSASIPACQCSSQRDMTVDLGFTLDLGAHTSCASGEVPKVKIGFAEASGCFKELKDSHGHPTGIFDTTQDAFVGGWHFRPNAGGGLRLRTDLHPVRLEEKASGVDLVIGNGTVPFPAGALPVAVPNAGVNPGGNGTAGRLLGVRIMKAIGFNDFPFSASLEVLWTNQGRSSTLTGSIEVDKLMKALGVVTTPPPGLGCTGAGCNQFSGGSDRFSATATNGVGFDLQSFEIKVSKIGVLVPPGDQLAGLDAFKLSYKEQSGVPMFEGELSVSIPRSNRSPGRTVPRPLVLKGRGRWVNDNQTGFTFAGGGFTIDGVNFPLGRIVQFQGLTGDLVTQPDPGMKLGALVSFIPVPATNEYLGEGTLELRGFSFATGCTTGGAPIDIHTQLESKAFEKEGLGKITIDGSNCWYFDSKILESNMMWTIRVDALGVKGIYEAGGALKGFIGEPAGSVVADVEGAVTLKLPFFPNIVGQMVVSTVGFAACATAGANPGTTPGATSTGGFQLGFGHAWASTSQAPQLLSSCDLGPWKVTVPHIRAAAGSGQAVTVRAGLPVEGFLAYGNGAPPRVELRGPKGERFTAPAAGKLVNTPKIVMLSSTIDNGVYFFVPHPSAGTWRIVSLDPAHPVSTVAHSDGLPDPRVHAHVTGRRSKRKLHYSFSPHAGLKVQFSESAGGLDRPLGGARSTSQGTIAFKPILTRSKHHVIRALLTENGLPRSSRIVARFDVKPPGRPGRIRKLKAKRHGTKLKLGFKGSHDAVSYLVVVSDTAHHTFRALITKTKLTVAGVPRKGRLNIRVNGENEFGVRGPAAKVRVK